MVGSPEQRVHQEAKTAPVSHEVMEMGTGDVIEVGTVTKKQDDGLSWPVNGVWESENESCDDAELWDSEEWRWPRLSTRFDRDRTCREGRRGLEEDRWRSG